MTDTGETSVVADVLVIGAGAGGGAAARRLQAGGLHVVALEQGRWFDRSEFRGGEWDWELAAGKEWSALVNVRRGQHDYPIDDAGSDMQILNFNGVGGGTILYNAIWPRLLPENFRERSLYGVAADWPLDYDELRPWYEATDREMGVSGLGGNPAYPEGIDYPSPPVDFGPGAMRVARAISARGWHWWPDAVAINSVSYGGRHACIQRGTCATGCGEGAKASVDATHWRGFVAEGGTLVTGARVRCITHDDAGLASGALWIDEDGQEHFQPARSVLVAANGIGTPRLLLNSATERFPNGLANSSDLVGRNLMLHPVALVSGTFEEQLDSWQGQYGSTVQCLEFGLHDARRGFYGGCKWSLHPAGSGPLQEALKQLARNDPATFHHRFGRGFGHTLAWSVIAEDMPEPDNRVTLSSDIVDSAGIPAPRITYRTSEDSLANLTWNAERAADVFRAAGAWSVDVYNPGGMNAHLMGTARMGNDPASSVVNRWGFCHDVPNLGVIDGSVFVTSGPVNPTSTIMALAARTAEHLVHNFDGIAAPRATRTVVPVLRAPAPVAPEPDATVQPWTGALATRFAELGDRLIPPCGDLPGAGTLVVERGLIGKVHDRRPDLHAGLTRALDHPVERFAELMTDDPAAWTAMTTLLAAAYYLDPEVQRQIGYPGQEPRPQTPSRFPAYVEEGLLDGVSEPGWRERWVQGQAIADA